MASVGNQFRIPQFLEAPTRQALVGVMLANNLAHGIEFDYFGIQKDGRRWVAWYRFPVDPKQIILEQFRGSS